MLHLGDDVMVRRRDVLMILDLADPQLESCLADLKADRVEITLHDDSRPKSAVLTQSHAGTMLYFSPISSATLYKRACQARDIAL